MSRQRSSVETRPSYDQRLVCPDNSRKNIWNKVEKSSKIGQVQKTLIFAFAEFLTAVTEVLFREIIHQSNVRFF